MKNKNTRTKNPKTSEEKLDKIIELLKYNLAIQLQHKGVPIPEIRNRLKVDMNDLAKILKSPKK